MNEVLDKYEAMDAFMQKQVLVFMDYLLSTKETAKAVSMLEYKDRILKISTWSEDDIKRFDKNNKSFNKWHIEEF